MSAIFDAMSLFTFWPQKFYSLLQRQFFFTKHTALNTESVLSNNTTTVSDKQSVQSDGTDLMYNSQASTFICPSADITIQHCTFKTNANFTNMHEFAIKLSTLVPCVWSTRFGSCSFRVCVVQQPGTTFHRICEAQTPGNSLSVALNTGYSSVRMAGGTSDRC